MLYVNSPVFVQVCMKGLEFHIFKFLIFFLLTPKTRNEERLRYLIRLESFPEYTEKQIY